MYGLFDLALGDLHFAVGVVIEEIWIFVHFYIRIQAYDVTHLRQCFGDVVQILTQQSHTEVLRW